MVICPLGTYPGESNPLTRQSDHYKIEEKIFGRNIYKTASSCCGFHFHYALPWGVFDFKKLKRDLDAILDEVDHTNRSDSPKCEKLNATSEVIGKTIYEILSPKVNDGNVKLHRVKVCESPSSGATYFEEKSAE